MSNTQPIQFSDESEFTPYFKTIMEASGPAYNTASANAKRNNAAHCRIITSTPGDLDSGPGRDAELIIEQTCRWTEKFYDWDTSEVYDYVDNNAGNKIVYIEYQYTELGKDEAWFNSVCAYLNNSPIKIQREIFLRRIHGSSESPFEPEELQALIELQGTPKPECDIFINKLWKIDVYTPLQRDRVYLVGVDVSNGYGQDNSAVTITDPYTLEVVAEFQSPYIGVKALYKFLYILIKKYIPKAILCVERNMNGEAILDFLRGTEIRPNIYFDNTKDPLNDRIDDKLDQKGFLKYEAARRKLYGVWTQGKSREIMMSLLDAHMKDFKEKFIGRNVINDIMKLIKNKRGKILAQEGFHDDAVMSYLMTLYVYYHGNNLHRFGFIKGELPDEDQRNKGLTHEEIVEELSEEDQKYFRGTDSKNVDDYNQAFVDQINKARKEMQMFDKNIGFINTAEDYEMMDDSMSGEIELELFNELNDM